MRSTCSWYRTTPKVSARSGARVGCRCSTGSSPLKRRTKASFIPPESGPGRYRASAAVRSSSLRAWISRNVERMPGLSIWKQPIVPPLSRRWEVSGSSADIDSSTESEPAYLSGWLAWMNSATSPNTVRPRMPSRSILTSPRASTDSRSIWVMVTPLLPECITGTNSVSRPGATIRPPACTERWRGNLSRASASLKICW